MSEIREIPVKSLSSVTRQSAQFFELLNSLTRIVSTANLTYQLNLRNLWEAFQ